MMGTILKGILKLEIGSISNSILTGNISSLDEGVKSYLQNIVGPLRLLQGLGRLLISWSSLRLPKFTRFSTSHFSRKHWKKLYQHRWTFRSISHLQKMDQFLPKQSSTPGAYMASNRSSSTRTALLQLTLLGKMPPSSSFDSLLSTLRTRLFLREMELLHSSLIHGAGCMDCMRKNT